MNGIGISEDMLRVNYRYTLGVPYLARPGSLFSTSLAYLFILAADRLKKAPGGRSSTPLAILTDDGQMQIYRRESTAVLRV